MRQGFVVFEGLGYESAIRHADDFGFDFVELMMPYIAKDEPRLGREYLDEHADGVRAALDEHGVDLLVHLPHAVEIGAPSDIVRGGAVEEIEECVRVATDLGAEKGVIHPTAFARRRVWDDAVIRDKVLDSIAELDAFCRDREFELCMENVPGSRFTIDDFDRFFEGTDCSMTLDTGHARISGMDEAAMAAFAAEHGDRIGHVHVNDNKSFVVGEDEAPNDDHLPTGAGDLDFATVLGGFVESGWEGTFSLEVHTRNPAFIELSKRQFERALGTAGS